MPVFLKHDLEGQIPSLKKQNLKHAKFATRSIQELFPPAVLDSATVRLFDYPLTIVAINDGHGHFSIHPLPLTIQLSSVNAIRCMDIDHNGTPDLILGGNEFGFLPQFGRLDASAGHILLNDGKAHWKIIPPSTSGLYQPGQIRDIAAIKGKDRDWLLFLVNDDFPALYKLK
jgi:hypothetical protein